MRQEGRASATEQPHAFRITTSWDDGHPSDLRLADLLVRHGLPGTFYVPMHNIRPTLSPTQIRDLASSFEIGAHTINHVRLRHLTAEQAWQEISQSKARLEDILGVPCKIFCFPGGSFRASHIAMLQRAGFAAVRTTEFLSFGRPHLRKGIALIPTTIQVHPHRTSSYILNAIKRRRVNALCTLARFWRRDWSTFSRSLLQQAAQVGGVFHIWGHSWEIDDGGLWKTLNEIFGVITQYRSQAALVTNLGLCEDVKTS